MKKLYYLLCLGLTTTAIQAQNVTDVSDLEGTWQFTVRMVSEASNSTVTIEDDEATMNFEVTVYGNDVTFTAAEQSDIVLNATFESSTGTLTFKPNQLGLVGSNYMGIGSWYSTGTASSITQIQGTVSADTYEFTPTKFQPFPLMPTMWSDFLATYTWGFCKCSYTSQSYTSGNIASAPEYYMYAVSKAVKVTASIEIADVNINEAPQDNPTQAIITVNITGSSLDNTEISVTYQLNDQSPVEMKTGNDAGTYTATIEYSKTAPATYIVKIKAVASVDGEVVASDENENAGTITVPKSAGIANIIAETSPSTARYYNLLGIEVKNPANGIYIKLVDNKATKVLIK